MSDVNILNNLKLLLTRPDATAGNAGAAVDPEIFAGMLNGSLSEALAQAGDGPAAEMVSAQPAPLASGEGEAIVNDASPPEPLMLAQEPASPVLPSLPISPEPISPVSQSLPLTQKLAPLTVAIKAMSPSQETGLPSSIDPDAKIETDQDVNDAADPSPVTADGAPLVSLPLVLPTPVPAPLPAPTGAAGVAVDHADAPVASRVALDSKAMPPVAGANSSAAPDDATLDGLRPALAAGTVLPDAILTPSADRPIAPDVATRDALKTVLAVPVAPSATHLVDPSLTGAELLSPSQPVSAVASSSGKLAPVVQELAAEGAVPALETDAPKNIKFEALSLLQFVRDQFKGRVAGGATEAEVAAISLPGKPAEKLGKNMPVAIAAAPMDTSPTDSAQPGILAPAQPAHGAGAQVQATVPVVDLSGSLGAQVVNMGVSGQWIDGLARDIAALSANGAQGRFQIDAAQLGPVQVDIRQGADGATVSLTVATQAAEMALRDDSDRFRLDAALSAVRITDVKIERAPHVAEAAQAGGVGKQAEQQQSPSQNPSGSHGAGQGMGQGASQSSGQGRWQARENFTQSHKAGGEAAVLNHQNERESRADDVRRGAGRARYA